MSAHCRQKQILRRQFPIIVNGIVAYCSSGLPKMKPIQICFTKRHPCHRHRNCCLLSRRLNARHREVSTTAFRFLRQTTENFVHAVVLQASASSITYRRSTYRNNCRLPAIPNRRRSFLMNIVRHQFTCSMKGFFKRNLCKQGEVASKQTEVNKSFHTNLFEKIIQIVWHQCGNRRWIFCISPAWSDIHIQSNTAFPAWTMDNNLHNKRND